MNSYLFCKFIDLYLEIAKEVNLLGESKNYDH